jgi:HK97 gp10 family phage protein
MGIGAKLTLVRGRNISQFLDQTIAPATEKSVAAACKLIQTTAQGLCPVLTGALRDSIQVNTVRVAFTSVAGTVGTDLYYAPYVEYGTGRRGGPAPYPHVMSWPGQRPQPFLRPAIDESRSPIDELFRQNLRVEQLG